MQAIRQKILLATAMNAALAACAPAQTPEMQVRVQDGAVTGMPIHWDAASAVLLQSTGGMQVIEQADILSHAILKTEFRPQTMSQARSQLQSELGSDFETLVSGPYVIAAPRGTVKRWDERFSILYSGFTRYFSVRGWSLRQPDFPLRVIVLRSRSEFLQYCSNYSGNMLANAVGSYFPRSNVCILYQLPGSSGTDWSETEATIVHEAVHQLAFNAGIHERLFSNPLWCVEGLATMFEEPSVYDHRVRSSSITTRISRRQVAVLSDVLTDTESLETLLASLIASDDAFRSEASIAYAGAWALTFYLSERMPGEYQQLTELQRARGLGDYTASDRIADFQTAIGVSPAMLARHIQRLLAPQ